MKEMAAAGLSAQQIYDSGRLPERTVEAMDKQLERCKFAVARQKAFVETIEPDFDALKLKARTYVQTTRKTFVQTIELASDALWL